MNNPIKRYLFKQGRTFNPVVKFVPVRDGLQNLVGYTAQCQVMDSNAVRHDVQATVAADGMSIQLFCSAQDTANWSVGIASIDVAYIFNGFVESTDTLLFEVEQRITIVE